MFGLIAIILFTLTLVEGLVYAARRVLGGSDSEVRAPKPVSWLLNWSRSTRSGFVRSGLLRHRVDGGVEPRYDFMRFRDHPLPLPSVRPDGRGRDMTDKMAPSIRRLYDQMPEPKYVISMGSCANCGGPLLGLYSTKGVDQLIPWMCTCPAAARRALLGGIVLLQKIIRARTSGRSGTGVTSSSLT